MGAGERGPAHGGPAPDLIPLLGYVRVSTAREEMISPDLQKSAITSWCLANGRRIVGWLEDLDRSGRDFAKRKIANGIEAITAGRAAEIGVYRFDRWGRNAMQSLANCHRVEQAGGQVRSATEPFDPETAIGKYSRTNAFAMAEMQSDLIGENWRAAQSHRLSGGRPGSGMARFGYRYSARCHGGDGTFSPCPETGPLLAESYRRYIAGGTGETVAAYLRERTSRSWSHKSALNALDSGFGAGLIVVGVFKGERRMPLSARSWLPGAHTPVITRAEWDAYLARRVAMSATPTRARAATYRLSGLLRCPCGGSAGHTNTAGTTIRCGRRHEDGGTGYLGRREAVEADVLAWLHGESDPGREADVAAAASRQAALVVAHRDEISALRARKKRLDDQMARAFEAWVAEAVPQAAYEQVRDKLTAKAAALEAEISLAQARLPAPPPREALATLAQWWERLPPPELNAALREVITCVLVVPGRKAQVRPRWITGY